MAGAALVPFGKEIVPTRDVGETPSGAVVVGAPAASSEGAIETPQR
jgi:hypothetical protein